jgi:hypothetical protein
MAEISGRSVKSMKSSASALFGAPFGMHQLSRKQRTPSLGMAKPSSGFSPWRETISPLQEWAIAISPEASDSP